MYQQKRGAQIWLLIGASALFLFSWYLMVHTFSYNRNTHTFWIASTAWSDFGAHIPLIRSFSKGTNLTALLHASPIQSPLFPGEAIRYHYGFYAIVGALEKLGLPIDLALNIPSALGFFALGICIFLLGTYTFSKKTGVLAVLFFLFNGSLSFLQFMRTHHSSFFSFSDIITNTRFAAFGPWDNGKISAFWTLNIYTNQRHLAFSYALTLMVILCAYCHMEKRNPRLFFLCTTFAMGILLFTNHAAAIILFVFLVWFFIIMRETRIPLMFAFITTLPAFLIATKTMSISPSITFLPWYLIKTPVSLLSFLQYWFENIGLHLFFIPLGAILSPKRIQKLFVPPLLFLFVAAHMFRFSPDMINNHKFFNFIILFSGIFTAHALLRAASFRFTKGIVLVSFVLLTYSGVIDLFPILNDHKGAITDTPNNKMAEYIEKNLPPDAIIANSTWFYHPASIAGRSIYSGYTYFTWSYGYKQDEREKSLVHLYQSANRQMLCNELQQRNIQAVELADTPETYLMPYMPLWNSLIPDYYDYTENRKLFLTTHICTIE